MTGTMPSPEPESQRVPPGRGPPTAVGVMVAPQPQESPEYRKLYVVTHADLQDYLVLQRGVRREVPGETVLDHAKIILEDVTETLIMNRVAGRLDWLNLWRRFEGVYGEWYGGKVDIGIAHSSTSSPPIRKVPQDGRGLDERTYRRERVVERFWCMRNRPDIFAEYDSAVEAIKIVGNVSSAERLGWKRLPDYVAGVRVMRGVFDVPQPLDGVIEELQKRARATGLPSGL